MTTKKTAPKTKKASNPAKTTWADLSRKEREKLAKQTRSKSRDLMREAKRLRQRAANAGPSWAANDRRVATSYEKCAAQRAALADLIERNLGGAR